jgi:hypothetical protein
VRRRNFLAGSIAVAGGLISRRGLAQDVGSRGAVVIGVDKCVDLPVLSAAGDGAKAIARWLMGQGFEVKLITDGGGRKIVRVSDVFEAVEDFVNRGTLEQLVVYFSGHGFLKDNAEHWMLSRAPANPNEAASLTESVEYAKDSGIPNVIFISDACRSTPASLQAERVHPSIIFPNTQGGQSRADVDKFLASLPGKPAYELPVGESINRFQGIFTAAFLKAFQSPDESMVLKLSDGRRVVPNRKLKNYLTREVQKMAQARSITLSQTPDCDVVSADEVFIGAVAEDANVGQNMLVAEATIFDVAQAELVRSGVSLLPGGSTTLIRGVDSEPSPRARLEAGFNSARDAVVESFKATDPESNSAPEKTGFAITGAQVAEVVTHPESSSAIVKRGAVSIIEVDPGARPACSVAIRFEDGTGTVLAAIAGFAGSIAVSPPGVSNVSYDPVRSDWRYGDFANERERLAQLRATVATSARFGVFRFEGKRKDREQQAANLADRIRVLKGYDPTLGLYAAYAYSEADLDDQIQSVRSYMRGDLNVDLFDVAMLAKALMDRDSGLDHNVAPFCPMLSQGWSLLRVKSVRLPEVVALARDQLLPALWTTFNQDGMDMLTEALRRGELR